MYAFNKSIHPTSESNSSNSSFVCSSEWLLKVVNASDLVFDAVKLGQTSYEIYNDSISS
jgi:hypothetical protein